MSKTKIFIGVLLLNNSFAWASSKTIDLDIELVRNHEVTQFKIHTKENESASVANKNYRVEVKSEDLNHSNKNISVKTVFQIYEVSGKQNKLLMSPEFILIDGIPTTLMSENASKSDTTHFKVTPHMNENNTVS